MITFSSEQLGSDDVELLKKHKDTVLEVLNTYLEEQGVSDVTSDIVGDGDKYRLRVLLVYKGIRISLAHSGKSNVKLSNGLFDIINCLQGYLIDWLNKLKHFEKFGIDLTLLEAIEDGKILPDCLHLEVASGETLSFRLSNSEDVCLYDVCYDPYFKVGYVERSVYIQVSPNDDGGVKFGEFTSLTVTAPTTLKLKTRFDVSSQFELAPALIKVLTLKGY